MPTIAMITAQYGNQGSVCQWWTELAAVRDTRWITTNLKTSAEGLSIQEFCIVVPPDKCMAIIQDKQRICLLDSHKGKEEQ